MTGVQTCALPIYGEAEELYSEWQRRKQSISKIFVDDLTNVMNFCDVYKFNTNGIFKVVNGDLPVLTSMFISGKITIETLRIIDDIFPFINSWENDPMIKIVMGDKLLRAEKLKGFVKYDREKLTKVFNHFKEELSL